MEWLNLHWVSDPSIWIGLFTLIILEIVLGVDNLVFIAILADNEANLRLRCLRGDAHNIAVQLGLKEGVVSRNGHRNLAAA